MEKLKNNHPNIKNLTYEKWNKLLLSSGNLKKR